MPVRLSLNLRISAVGSVLVCSRRNHGHFGHPRDIRECQRPLDRMPLHHRPLLIGEFGWFVDDFMRQAHLPMSWSSPAMPQHGNLVFIERQEGAQGNGKDRGVDRWAKVYSSYILMLVRPRKASRFSRMSSTMDWTVVFILRMLMALSRCTDWIISLTVSTALMKSVEAFFSFLRALPVFLSTMIAGESRYEDAGLRERRSRPSCIDKERGVFVHQDGKRDGLLLREPGLKVIPPISLARNCSMSSDWLWSTGTEWVSKNSSPPNKIKRRLSALRQQLPNHDHKLFGGCKQRGVRFRIEGRIFYQSARCWNVVLAALISCCFA